MRNCSIFLRLNSILQKIATMFVSKKSVGGVFKCAVNDR